MTSPHNFHHPYEPYDIQLEFMRALYQCIEQKKVGIFESPTGTGKSLSLICASLTWLRDHQLADAERLGDEDEGEPDWVVEHAKNARRVEFIERRKARESKLQKIRQKEAQQRKRYDSGEPLAKRTKIHNDLPGRQSTDADAEFLLADYESEGESENRGAKEELGGISSESLELAVRLGLAPDSKENDEEEIEEQVKIYFCSRTHSQLSQFAHELRRVQIPFPDVKDLSLIDGLTEEIKHVSLASRKNLCINKDVRRLQSTVAINERCLEMQQSKTTNKKCSHLPNKENQTLVHQFRDLALAKIRDIEDLGQLGERIGICPYYATRATIRPSEIVTLPYPLLLQKSARDALDIDLKNHIVIIDEAHNLMDAIAGIYSEQIQLSQLSQARDQLTAYLLKFRTRLKGKNRVYVAQTVRLIDSLISYLQSLAAKSGTISEGIINISNALVGKGVDQINLYKLMGYLQESKLARKVDGYTAFREEDDTQKEVSTPVLTQCQAFFQALTYPFKEGRFFYTVENGDVRLAYLLLDPTNHFKDIVEDARAVILAGGTMSPMEDYKQHLFSYVGSDRLMTLSCGHVIPAENLTAMPLYKDQSGTELDFTYEKRNNPAVIRTLGRIIVKLVSIIPDGVVVFFPSYAYLAHVLAQWKKQQGNQRSTFEELELHKTIIYEDKSQSTAVDDTLARYTAIIQDPDQRGAVLLSVVGGKLSEGINFSDSLGRGVIVVGLPFPNIQSAEWKAKLEYIEQQTLSTGKPVSEAKSASRTFYENACMRAVNQSIGRAIRHKNDYAGIFLLDRRYSTSRIQSKLPGWIQNGLLYENDGTMSHQVEMRIKSFFATKQ